jgi:patatin-related protein
MSIAPVSYAAQREVRLGLVLYGGVSLAIYIYGAALEFLRLVRASQALEAGKPDNSGYIQALRRTNARAAVDIIAGTSAGGINGIALAKALTQGGNLDSLRRLWVDEGDLLKLMHPAGRKGVTSLIDADRYQRMAKDALDSIDPNPASRAPRAPVMDLFVTSTNLHGKRVERTDALGNPMQSREYGKVFHRRYRTCGYNPHDTTLGYEQDDFAPRHNAALALMCRATSSFPMAIAPAKLDAALADSLPLEVGEDPPLWLSDGGVLDNKPFTDMLATIFARSADLPVDRAVFFVEPDPGGIDAPKSVPLEPDPLTVATKTMFAIPRYESLGTDLRSLEDHNRRVARSQRALASAEERLRTLGLQKQNYRQFLESQIGFQMYEALKVEGVVRRVSGYFHNAVGKENEAAQAAFDAALSARASNQAAFLKAFDIPYRVRKYFRVLEVLGQLYGQRALKPHAARLGILEQRVWVALERARQAEWQAWSLDGQHRALLLALRTDRGESITQNVGALKDQAHRYLAAELDVVRARGDEACAALDDYITQLKSQGVQADFPQETFASLVERFELRDLFLYPVAELAQLGERDRVDLVRISPDAATQIPRAARDKLAGDALFHFGGFFKKEWRQNDIPWGRLDAAELLVRALARGQGVPDTEVSDLVSAVHRDILAEEQKHSDILRDMQPGEDYRAFLKNPKRFSIGAEGPANVDVTYWNQLAGRSLQVLGVMMGSVSEHADAAGSVRWASGKLSAGLRWLARGWSVAITPVVEGLAGTSAPRGNAYRFLLVGAWAWGAGTLVLTALRLASPGWRLALAAALALLPLWAFGWFRRGTMRYVASGVSLLLPLGALGSTMWYWDTAEGLDTWARWLVATSVPISGLGMLALWVVSNLVGKRFLKR